jgi:hypothetical protein
MEGNARHSRTEQSREGLSCPVLSSPKCGTPTSSVWTGTMRNTRHSPPVSSVSRLQHDNENGAASGILKACNV